MTETCVRIYDDVVSKEWCKETIDMFEKTKKGFDPKNPDKKIDVVDADKNGGGSTLSKKKINKTI